MIARAFDLLFVLALVAPPATVVIGAALLLLPRRVRRGFGVRQTPRTVGA